MLSDSAAAQTNGLLQLPQATVAAGIPASATQTVCTTEIATYSAAKTGDGCLPTQALLKTPESTAIDSYGNIYIADYSNKEIRVIYQGNPALEAAIIASYGKSTLTSLTPGYIYDLVGGGTLTNITGAGGTGYSTVAYPNGIALDGDGNVFFSNGTTGMGVFYVAGTKLLSLLENVGSPTTSVTPGHFYTLTVSSTTANYSGDGALAYNALFDVPKGIAIDANENVYIADKSNNAIRKITASTGLISTVVGGPGCTQGTKASCKTGTPGDNGPATSAEVYGPYEVALDANGNLYIADTTAARVRVLYQGAGTVPGVANPVSGYIYTVAGGGTLTTSGAAATSIKFTTVSGIGLDGAGHLYVSDSSANKIWEIDLTTQIGAIVAGGGSATTVGGVCSSTNASGSVSTDTLGDGCPGTQAVLAAPQGKISFDGQGDAYFADYTNNLLRKLTAPLSFATAAVGTTSVQTIGFTALTAQTLGAVSFGLQGVTGTTDFADAGSSTCVAKASLTAGASCLLNVAFAPVAPGLRRGFASTTNSGGTIVNSAIFGGTATGPALAIDPGTAASVGTGLIPSGVTVDPSGAIYIADKKSGSVLVYASASATSPSATLITGLSAPGQIAVGANGNVAVADTGNNRIAIYSKMLQTVSYFTGSLNAPAGIAADAAGDLYVSDTGNSRIVKFSPGGVLSIVPSSVVNPGHLSIDSSGNLYVVDAGNQRVVELAAGTAVQTTVSTGSVTPVSVAVDSAGNLYLLDANLLQLTMLSANGNSTTLNTGYTTPVDLALNQYGSVYVADAGSGSVQVLNRQLAGLSFGVGNVGDTSAAQSFTLNNIGSASLVFTNTAIDSSTGSSAFATTSAVSNGCSSTTLTAGGNCSLQSTFLPPTTGSFSAVLTFPSNAIAAGAAVVDLTGTGAVLAKTTTSLTLTNPSSATGLTYGTPLTVSASVAAATGTGTPSGKITIYVNGIAQKTFTITSTALSYTFTPTTIGSIPVTAVYSGDNTFASSYSALIFSIAAAPTTTTLSAMPNLTAGALTLTAQVSSAIAGVSGPVTFTNGSKSLGTVSINASGVATLTVTSIASLGSSYVASYAGNSTYAASTSSVQTVAGDFTLGTATTLSTAQGGIAAGTFAVTPYFGLSGAVSFACSGAPTNALCRFLPQTVSFTGSADPAASVQLQVFTNTSTTLAEARPEPANLRPFGMVSVATLIGCCLWTRRRLPRGGVLFLLFLGLLSAGAMTGCGNGAAAAIDPGQYVTPAGTYSIVITATAANGATHSSTASLLITSN